MLFFSTIDPELASRFSPKMFGRLLIIIEKIVLVVKANSASGFPTPRDAFLRMGPTCNRVDTRVPFLYPSLV